MWCSVTAVFPTNFETNVEYGFLVVLLGACESTTVLTCVCTRRHPQRTLRTTWVTLSSLLSLSRFLAPPCPSRRVPQKCRGQWRTDDHRAALALHPTSCCGRSRQWSWSHSLSGAIQPHSAVESNLNAACSSCLLLRRNVATLFLAIALVAMCQRVEGQTQIIGNYTKTLTLTTGLPAFIPFTDRAAAVLLTFGGPVPDGSPSGGVAPVTCDCLLGRLQCQDYLSLASTGYSTLVR